MTNSRAVAAEILYGVLEQGEKSHLLLNRAFAEHGGMAPRDRGFITALVHGTLENLILLDHRLNEISSVKIGDMKPWVRTVLRMGLYQLFFTDRIPASAVVSESVKILQAKQLAGLGGFVNGVLRTAARKTDWKELPPAVRCSLPGRLWKRLVRDFGEEETLRIAESLREPAGLCVRVNLSRTEPETVIRLFAEEGYRAERTLLPEVLSLEKDRDAAEPKPLEKTEAFRKGLVQAQDVSSVLAVKLAAPGKGARILDLCAAPGGKSIHAADLAGPEGSVLACDLSDDKVKLLEENIRRSGFENIKAEKADATLYDGAKKAAFDLVIADLPCSGFGVIGRKPEIRYRVKEADILALAALQRQILENAVRYVKPGGRLLFSTCTLTKEENADNAAWLKEQAGLRPFNFEAAVPEIFRQAYREGCLQLLPGRICDGFFISLFEKG